MEGLSAASSILAVLSLAIQVTEIVHNYARHAAHAPANIADLLHELDALSFVLRQLGDLLGDGDGDKQDVRNAAFQGSSVLRTARDACRVKMEGLMVRLERQQGGKGVGKAFRRLRWPFEVHEVRDVVETLRRCTQTFHFSLDIDNCKLLSKTSEEVKGALDKQLMILEATRETVPALRADIDAKAQNMQGVLQLIVDVSSHTASNIDLLNVGIEDLKATQDRNDRENILKWLVKTDTSTNYVAAREKHEEKTGEWLVDSHEYRLWGAQPSSILWLHGIPGCGKTVLCSTILEDLYKQHSPQKNTLVAYHFFDFNDILKQRVKEAMCSVLAQCFSQTQEIPPSLRSLYESYLHGQQQPSLTSILTVLRSMATETNGVFIVFDALDECDDIDEILKIISQINSWNLSSIHVLLTSRWIASIEECLRSLSATEISVQDAKVNADISIHVKSRINKHKLKKWSNRPAIMKQIETALVQGACGMFRWVALQLDALEKCITVAQLQNTLKSLPKTLYETYDRVILGIHEEHRNMAILALQWLSYSTRPLKVFEVAEALTMADEFENFDPENRVSAPTDVLIICSSLVSLYQPAQEGQAVAAEKKIPTELYELRLAHFSVKEYLLSNQRIATLWFSGFSELSANLIIAQNCIAYLQYFQELEPRPFKQRDLSQFAQYPLLDYILGGSWLEHLRRIPETEKNEQLRQRIRDFFDHRNPAYSNWTKYRDIKPDDPERTASPLVVAAGYGWTVVLSVLLEEGQDINQRSGAEGRTALEAAVRGRHMQTLQQLIRHSARIQSEPGVGTSPLYDAVWTDNLLIARTLLEAGALVNVEGGLFGTPLQVAAYYGRLAMVELLLQHGASPLQPGPYGNALDIAEQRHHWADVILLTKAAVETIAQWFLSQEESRAERRTVSPGSGQEYVLRLGKRAKWSNLETSTPSTPHAQTLEHQLKKCDEVKKLLDVDSTSKKSEEIVQSALTRVRKLLQQTSLVEIGTSGSSTPSEYEAMERWSAFPIDATEKNMHFPSPAVQATSGEQNVPTLNFILATPRASPNASPLLSPRIIPDPPPEPIVDELRGRALLPALTL